MGEKRRGSQASQWKSYALKMAATLLQKEGRVTAPHRLEKEKIEFPFCRDWKQ
jgi:hypothetical protein